MLIPKKIADNKEQYCQMYRDGYTVKQIGEAMGCSLFIARKRLGFWGVKIRTHKEIGELQTEYVPTKSEIRAKTLQIQTEWDDETEMERAGKVLDAVEVPTVKLLGGERKTKDRSSGRRIW